LVNYDRPSLHGRVFNAQFWQTNFSWPGEKNIPKDLYLPEFRPDYAGQNLPEAVAAAGYGHLNAPYPFYEWNGLRFISLSDAELKRAQHEPARWSGYIYFHSYKLASAADVPLAAGAKWDSRTQSRILPGFGVDTLQTVSVVLETLDPWCLPFIHQPNSFHWFQNFFLLYNPKKQESILAEGYGGQSTSSALSYFELNRRELRFDFGSLLDARGAPSKLSDADISSWLADARLVELREVDPRDFYCPATIDPFSLPEKMVGFPTTKNP
jgi:hypothetical protein